MQDKQRENSGFIETINLSKFYSLKHGFFKQLLGHDLDQVFAVDNVNLKLYPGEILALVGESGSGKTTIGKLITLLEKTTKGQIKHNGLDVTNISGSNLKSYRKKVQMIFQNPYESLDPRKTIYSSLMEPLKIQGFSNKYEIHEKVIESMKQVDLDHSKNFLNRFPHDLSGGQLQRISIARTLVLSPSIIVADEPVSMLDVSVRSGVMNLILNLRDKLKISCIFITHDLSVARYMSDNICVMYLGSILEKGPTEQIILRAAHPYTRMLIMAVPEYQIRRKRNRVRITGEVLSVKKIPKGCRFHTRCPMVKEICRLENPPSIEVSPERWSSCHFSAEVYEMNNSQFGKHILKFN